ncbi:helix-turn-helix domain-containing protein [Paenibacillus sp. N3/727]|uniref:PucR family transcriptional regulator n=1 Tax=Paenibacillus sp. N3/727 TaxID=2925845 RepID=UPI001F52BFE5|nr:PucR family transcriptional regulator [Paenibacillus sp. N3/727]UNK18607.1 helix-turn-helix domain-containing protein [Paenibacillus sp. N3/727]
MAEMEQILLNLKNALGIPMALKLLDEKETRMMMESLKQSSLQEQASDRKSHSVSRMKNRNKELIDAGAVYYTGQGEVWFTIPAHNELPVVITAPAAMVTESEVKLIGLLLSSIADSASSVKGPRNDVKAEEERNAQLMGVWLNTRVDAGEYQVGLPEEFSEKVAMSEEMIPFLLANESEHPANTTFKSLQRLLRSYFGGEIVLVPLKEKEWLVLADPQLLDGLTDEKDDATGEGDQDLLSLFCMGLYELVSNEWVGDFHIAAIPAVKVQQDLPDGLRQLRETMIIGRTFQVKEHIHLSTGLHLERLLFSIPEPQRSRFLEEYASHHTDVFEDTETLSTLESFFDLDCNVSETAKRLYIHRNTLLYRLDKIKQETGLDVRSFGDAVLVKITLLLYKVTKRK